MNMTIEFQQLFFLEKNKPKNKSKYANVHNNIKCLLKV